MHVSRTHHVGKKRNSGISGYSEVFMSLPRPAQAQSWSLSRTLDPRPLCSDPASSSLPLAENKKDKYIEMVADVSGKIPRPRVTAPRLYKQGRIVIARNLRGNAPGLAKIPQTSGSTPIPPSSPESSVVHPPSDEQSVQIERPHDANPKASPTLRNLDKTVPIPSPVPAVEEQKTLLM